MTSGELRALNKIRQFRVSNALVYLVWGILTAGKAFGLSSKSSVYLLATAVAMLFAALDFIARPLPPTPFLLGMSLCGIGFVAWRLSGNTSLLLAAIMISLFQKADFSTLVKFTLIVYGLIAITRLVMATMGIIDMQPVFYYERSATRYGMGFESPNSAQSVLAYITSLLALSHMKRGRKRLLMIVFLAFSIYIYSYTGSRTSMICSIAITVGILLPKNMLAFIMRRCACLQWVVPLIGIIASVTYHQWAGSVDLGTFESRFLDAGNLIANGGVSLCGATVPGVLDLGYVRMLGEYGVVGFSMVCALYIYTAYVLRKHAMWNELLTLSTYAIFCVFEAYCTTVTLNPAVMIAAMALAASREHLPTLIHPYCPEVRRS